MAKWVIPPILLVEYKSNYPQMVGESDFVQEIVEDRNAKDAEISELKEKLERAVSLGNQMAGIIEHGLIGWYDAVRAWDRFTLELKGKGHE